MTIKTTTCCDCECATTFCPHCGRKLQEGSLSQLMIHLRQGQKTARRNLELARQTNEMDRGRDHSERWQTKYAQGVRTEEKWTRWLELIKEAFDLE